MGDALEMLYNPSHASRATRTAPFMLLTVVSTNGGGAGGTNLPGGRSGWLSVAGSGNPSFGQDVEPCAGSNREYKNELESGFSGKGRKWADTGRLHCVFQKRYSLGLWGQELSNQGAP